MKNENTTSRNGPWSREQAWTWYDRQPWLRGCNYMPSDCANRVDQWQSLGFESRFETQRRELALMEEIGFNAVRLIVQFEVWRDEHEGFLDRFERTIALCASHNIRCMIVFANDCTVPKEPYFDYFEKRLGPQKIDWGYHGGVSHSQHGTYPGEVGYTVLDDPVQSERFYRMVEEIMTRYRDDERIVVWNLFNEPGSARRWNISAPHLRRLFEIGWKINPVQPLAADLWASFGRDPERTVEVLAGELSDVISYHCYGDYPTQVELIADLRRRYGRPLMITEWLHRIFRNDVFTAYPLYYIEKIACFAWGFVAGLYQTYEPWESLWNAEKAGRGDDLDFTKWQHDLIRPGLRPYDPREIKLIKRFNALADADSDSR